jgi:hypothetical protein
MPEIPPDLSLVKQLHGRTVFRVLSSFGFTEEKKKFASFSVSYTFFFRSSLGGTFLFEHLADPFRTQSMSILVCLDGSADRNEVARSFTYPFGSEVPIFIIFNMFKTYFKRVKRKLKIKIKNSLPLLPVMSCRPQSSEVDGNPALAAASTLAASSSSSSIDRFSLLWSASSASGGVRKPIYAWSFQ